MTAHHPLQCPSSHLQTTGCIANVMASNILQACNHRIAMCHGPKIRVFRGFGHPSDKGSSRIILGIYILIFTDFPDHPQCGLISFQALKRCGANYHPSFDPHMKPTLSYDHIANGCIVYICIHHYTPSMWIIMDLYGIFHRF